MVFTHDTDAALLAAVSLVNSGDEVGEPLGPAVTESSGVSSPASRIGTRGDDADLR